MLSSEGDNQTEEESKEVSVNRSLLRQRLSVMQKVTLSTCHAAKGLEWPVVIVPSGTYFLS